MAYNKAQVTDAGNALFAQILANKSSLSIDKIEISNIQLAASTVITSMTKIDNVVQTTSANGLQKSGNSFIISTAVSNANVTTDYQAWVFGIWGSDSANGTSTLIEVITTTGTPDTIPAYSGSTPVTYNYKFATALSNASSISLSMSNAAYASNDTVLHTSGNETSTGIKTFEKIEVSNSNTPDIVLTDGASISLDSGESKFTPANNSTVVHTTGNETIGGQKKFDTDPTDSAGNAYAKTVDVNQQLDKKVNVSDMRKPASDVAGIEEVSTLQTQVNNSAVGTNLLAGTSNVLTTIPNVTGWGTGIPNYYSVETLEANQTYTVSCYLEPAEHDATIYTHVAGNDIHGTIITAGSKGISTLTITLSPEDIQVASHFWISFTSFQKDNSAISYKGFKLEKGSVATDWCPNPKDKADDSKVAHLSGANNFDTVPTVNNNPLLLASSLPSDLARTSQQTNFTAGLQKGGLDVATKSDVTAAVNTATANMVDPSKATNFTAGLQSGGVDVATAADLKSVEDSAWINVKPSTSNLTSISGDIFIKYDSASDGRNSKIGGYFNLNFADTIYPNLDTTLFTLPDGFEFDFDNIPKDANGYIMSSSDTSTAHLVTGMGYQYWNGNLHTIGWKFRIGAGLKDMLIVFYDTSGYNFTHLVDLNASLIQMQDSGGTSQTAYLPIALKKV